MLSYRHSFHAGNHADVLKHTVLSLILQAMKEKEKAIFYLDTHAGAGGYQLQNEYAGRTGEYLAGVARIWQQPDVPVELAPLLSVLRAFNHGDRLSFYPGSSLIARHLLRQQDSLQLNELHPADVSLLRSCFRHDTRTHIERADGFQQLKAKLPPPSRRGVILIDPSYEIKTDYQMVVQGILDGYQRFATGIYALWYPVVLRQQVKRILRALQESGIRGVLQIELALKPDNTQRGMTASGMIVINPPWKLEQQMRNVLPWLHSRLSPEKTGQALVQWLVPE